MLDVKPNTAAVRLTVTVVRDGYETVSREFVAEATGTARPLRTPYDMCTALRTDAKVWLETLQSKASKPRPVRVNRWQRFLLALAGLPTPTRATVLVGPPKDTNGETGTEFTTAATSISVDSPDYTDTVSVAGNTNGSPYELAEELLNTVVFDLRQRLADKRYDLEHAR